MEVKDPIVPIEIEDFTDTEKKIILKVIARDEEVRIQEKNKIQELKQQLLSLREKGVEDGQEEIYGRVCKRCRTPLGVIFNTGALCPNCSHKVCKNCRDVVPQLKSGWLCLVCSKIRAIRAESGAWFFDCGMKKQKRNSMYGSLLLKSLFSKASKKDTITYQEPVWDEIIEKDDLAVTDRHLGDYLMISPTDSGGYTINDGSVLQENNKTSSGESSESVSKGEDVLHSPTESSREDSMANSHTLSTIVIENLDEPQSEQAEDRIKQISNEDEDVVSTVDVAGEVMVGFKYVNDNVFEVEVYRARNLLAVDKRNNTTDPYVKVYLLPDVNSGGKRKTKPQRHDLNPEFNETVKFEKMSYDDLLTKTCSVSVWHYDFYNKNTFLGEFSVNLDLLVESGFSLKESTPQWYTLNTKKVQRKQIKFIGEIVLLLYYQAPTSVMYKSKKDLVNPTNPTKGCLHLNVIKASQVQAVYDGSYSNPFCKVVLISPNLRQQKHKTHVVYETTDPVWNMEFVFSNISWMSLSTSVLQVSVWDYEKGNHNALLGGTRLGLGAKQDDMLHDSFGKEVDVWNEMLENPNIPATFTVPLRSTLDSVKKKVFVPPVPVRIVNEEEHRKLMLGRQTRYSKNVDLLDTQSLRSASSMMSLYSSAGGEHRGLIITGEILFNLKYADGVLSVVIVKAKDLAACNEKHQTSDAYVKVYLLPDKTKTSKKKTSHRPKTLNPVWNETVQYNISKEDLLKKILQVSVWNYDRFGRNDFLGEVQVNMKYYAHSNSLDVNESVWYTLQEMALVSVGGVNENKGELTLALKYDHEVLSVIVKDAIGLPQIDPEKALNPFVRCFLLPDRSRKSKRKTSFKKATKNPSWNEKIEYSNIKFEELNSHVLEVTVWNHNSSGHEFLAGTRLGLAEGDEYWHDCQDKELGIWESMMHHLGIYAEYTIPLRGTMSTRKGQDPNSVPVVTIESQRESIFLDTYDKLLQFCVPLVRIALQFVSPENIKEDRKKRKHVKGVLKVHLKEGRYLPTKPNGDVPSPFCKMFMYPKKKNLKFKTQAYIKSVEPNWDTGMSFEGVTLEELTGRCLEIAVYDEISEKSTQLLGLARLGSGGHLEKWDDSQGREVEIWNSMLNNPDKWVSMAIPLRQLPAESSPSDSQSEKTVDYSAKDKTESEVVFFEEEVDLEESFKCKDGGSESPRTAALRAMGIHANSIVENMEEEQPVYNLPPVALSPILEDLEPELQPNESPYSLLEEEEEDVKLGKQKPKQSLAVSLLKRSSSQTSLTSTYSTDSANVYGQVPVRGEVQFGMKYNQTTGKFEVHVFKAKDLAAIESRKESSDSFCKVYLLPDKTKKGKRKTKTVKRTLCPEWEEIMEFSISMRDLRTRTLWLSIWHKERLGRNIFLGEVMMNMDTLFDQIDLEASVPKYYTLAEKGEAPSSQLYNGELKVSLVFEDKGLKNEKVSGVLSNEDTSKKKKKKKTATKEVTGRVKIHIKEGCDLPAADNDGFSDPFCKIYLLPMRNRKSKRKTPVIRHTCDPVWDYQMQYELDYEDLADYGVEFTVWDWDRNGGNDLLGCARLNLGTNQENWDDAEGAEIAAWKHLIDEPNKWKDFSLPLRSSQDKKKKSN